MSNGLNVNELRETAENIIGKHSLSHLFTSTKINSEGKVIGKTPSILSDDPEDYEDAIKMKFIIMLTIFAK